MNIIWLGHSSFRIEIEDQVLLVDPWLTGNPAFEGHSKSDAVNGATHILISHGHEDHTGEAIELSKSLGIPIVGIYDLMNYWGTQKAVETIGFGKGGTVKLGHVAVTLVNAVHSSSFPSDKGPVYAGSEAGFMIEGDGHTIYFSGDTDVMADMKIFNDLHAPDIGILCAGGHFTMDMRRAAYAAKTFFDFKTVIPCHYKTFPLLEQSAQVLIDGLPGVNVIEPEVMKAIAL